MAVVLRLDGLRQGNPGKPPIAPKGPPFFHSGGPIDTECLPLKNTKRFSTVWVTWAICL